MSILSIPLTTEEEAAVAAQAKAQGITVGSLARKAIRQIIRSTSGNSLMFLIGNRFRLPGMSVVESNSQAL